MTDTFAARANCDALRYCPRGEASNSSGNSGASSTLSIHGSARRNAWRRDDGEGHCLPTGGLRRLEHCLREKGHEPIAATLWG
jgi:hypothetical protein